MASGAHAVVVDLEDAVSGDAKDGRMIDRPVVLAAAVRAGLPDLNAGPVPDRRYSTVPT
jgi:citrate lyase beta subunit